MEKVVTSGRAFSQLTVPPHPRYISRYKRERNEWLLDGVRGHNKHRGKFREIQNWIGSSDDIGEAKFVPVAPGAALSKGLDTWEKFIHDSDTDPLIQLALIHAEFESLHPFIDGNGRIGRMMIPIYLFEKKLLHTPMFYVSAYLEKNRDEYYERLRAVSAKYEWTPWCVFFLTAVRLQAEHNESKVRQVLKLYEDSKSRVIRLTHSQHAIHALDFIFDQPIFNSTTFKTGSSIPDSTARRILALFTDDGILNVVRERARKRPKVLAFSELLNITEGKDLL